MADVDVMQTYTTTERKTRKVKKTTKRRESNTEGGVSEVTITEIENSNYNNGDAAAPGYVLC